VNNERLFWRVYAVVVAVAGLLALLAVAFGHIGLYEGRVAATAWAALLSGATLFAGLHLLRRVGRVAWTLPAGAVIAFALMTNGIWSNDFNGNEVKWKWAWTALVYILVALIAAGLRLLIPDDPVSRAAFIGTLLCFAIAGGLVVKNIWGSFGTSGGDARGGLAAFVLGVTGFLLAPALRRLRDHAGTPGQSVS
jgi:hypothetical protein